MSSLLAGRKAGRCDKNRCGSLSRITIGVRTFLASLLIPDMKLLSGCADERGRGISPTQQSGGGRAGYELLAATHIPADCSNIEIAVSISVAAERSSGSGDMA